MLVKEDKVTNQSDLPYRGDWFLQLQARALDAAPQCGAPQRDEEV